MSFPNGTVVGLVAAGIIPVTLLYLVGLDFAARKAGLSGIGTLTLIRMAGLETWKIPWFALPLGPALLLRVPFGIARRFGKGRLFGWGLLLLPFVFFPILGFGTATYSRD